MVISMQFQAKYNWHQRGTADIRSAIMPSKLEQLQLQFRQKLMQEKEERLIKIHTDSQQKALNKVAKYDSSQVKSRNNAGNGMPRKVTSISTSPLHQSPTKKGSPGVDRSRPLPPISREQQIQRNPIHASRSPHSSVSSESSMRVPLHNGTRARSMDYDGGFCNGASKTNGRSTHETYKSTYYGRKSPETESWSTKQNQRSQISPKANYEATVKVPNGHSAADHVKSSAEQRTITGNAYKPSSTKTVMKGKPKTTVSLTPTRKVSTDTKTKNDTVPRKPPNSNQDQCRFCSRNFNKDRIEKHVLICGKASQKKVKVFDTTKMRVNGTEAERFVRKTALKPQEAPKPKKFNWKKQHEDFINTIRQAKIAQRHLAAGGKLSDLPAPPPMDTSDYVPCPHCGRKFAEGAAERHIPKCKNILSNKKMPIRRK